MVAIKDEVDDSHEQEYWGHDAEDEDQHGPAKDSRSMPDEAGTPFDSIEGAHDYIRLLGEAVEDAQKSITEDLAEAAATKGVERRVDALRLVDYKLNQLRQHMSATSRILNDLRTLRRLLLGG
jgi:hypothetical protein